ncbi:MAG: hypothetical protein QOF37_3132, partial [Thermoleophilaceae bacterium]|nr:hypothetical protein [Thermoleophilaceae bacterium]
MTADPDRAHPDPDAKPLAIVLRLLRADAPGQVVGTPQNWPRWAVLLPHVLAATEHYLAANDREPSRGSWEPAWWLLDRAGTYIQAHGRTPEGHPLSGRDVALTDTSKGSNHPQVAPSLNNLAVALGEPAAARSL